VHLFEYVGDPLDHLTSTVQIIGGAMATKAVVKKVGSKKIVKVEENYSLNDVLLRGRVSQEAVEKELPSGDKVVEFRLIVTRDKQPGVDTLDIASWSSKSRRAALSLAPDEWIEVSGSIHRRFWSGAAGLASRWQVEAVEISRI
jgi:single-strand DNA-binding protein